MVNEIRRQEEWGWKVALCFALEGLAAGSYMVATVLRSTGLYPHLVIFATPVILAAGLLVLWSHLGRRARAYLVFARPRSSWIARGSMLLLLFFLVSAFHMATILWLSTVPLEAYVMVVGFLAATGVVLYTGCVLRSVKTISFWHSPFLLVGFFLASLLGGVAINGLGILWELGGEQAGEVVVRLIGWGLLLSVLSLGSLLGHGLQAKPTPWKSLLPLFRSGTLLSLLATLAVGVFIVTGSPFSYPAGIVYFGLCLLFGFLLRFYVLQQGWRLPSLVLMDIPGNWDPRV
jgi:formate-dependent nitrite reductase membrane component NrfD